MNTPPRRIGIDARLVAYRTGGISNYIESLIGALAEIEATDARHHYLIGEHRKARQRLSGRFERAVLWTPCHHRLESLTLSAELFPHRLDVWHTTDFIPPRRGAKHHVVSVHDLNFLVYPQFLTPESRRYYNDQIAWAVHHADHILTISEASKRDIVSMLGVPADKITVQLCGVGSQFRPESAAACDQVRRALELPPRYLLFVGTLEPRKNIAGLVTTYAEMHAQGGVPPLVLAGQPGWMFEETQRQIDDLRLTDHILFRRFDPHQLPALYTMADLLVMPSFYEGFGLPPLEAMACGTIPVVSERSALPEVVGEVGCRVNPDDPASIAQGMWAVLHADESWRTHMREAGLARAQTFTWQRVAAIARTVYEAVGT